MTRDEVRRMLQAPNTTRDKDKPRSVAPHPESDNLRRRIAREMDAKYGDPGRQAERRLRDCEGNTPELPEVPDTYKPEPDFVGGDALIPLPFSFDSFVGASGSITAVKIKIYPYTAAVVCHHARLMDDGTLHSSNATHTMPDGNETVTLDEGTNEIYCKISSFAMGGSGGDDVPTFDISVVNNPTPADGESYFLLAKIGMTSGVATVFEWAHTGIIHVFTWDIGTYVMSAVLNGDLISGYTLATTTRKLMLGPCFASGAIT